MFNLYPIPFLVSVAARKKANYYCFANLMLLNKKNNNNIALCSENFFLRFLSVLSPRCKSVWCVCSLGFRKRMGRRWFILFRFEGGSSRVLLWYCGDLNDKRIQSRHSLTRDALMRIFWGGRISDHDRDTRYLYKPRDFFHCILLTLTVISNW